MLIAGLIFAALAALLHVVIFYMESINWEGPLARKTFGGTAEEARPHAFYAFNQGFYNLFLALQATIGIVITLAGQRTVGLTLVLAGTAAMLAAAVVLALASATHRAAATKQGTLPLLAVGCVVASLLP